MKNTFLLSLIFFLSINLQAQLKHDFGFERDQSLIIRDSIGLPYNLAWVGGFNSVHFNSIDLNGDGFEDLVIFDKHRYKVLPFINQGISDSISYIYEPSYEYIFPFIDSWLNLIDYNCDGQKDFFYHYQPVAGMRGYKNIAAAGSTPEFVFDIHVLESDQGTMVNIANTPADFPGFADFDGDGDLDVISFFGLGTFIHYHKNISVETGNGCNQMILKKVDNCWGDIAEDANNNQIIMNQPCGWKAPDEGKGTKHAGSTMGLYDLNNDGLQDLLLGDKDFLSLFMLTNGDHPDSSIVSNVDTMFPFYDTPVNLNSFPQPSFIDINNDNKTDLLIGSFEDVRNVTDHLNGSMLYLNTHSDSLPDFEYSTSQFLIDQMVDHSAGSYPVLFDYDGDQLLDLFVGNYGYHDSMYYSFGDLKAEYISKVALYKNIGSPTQPEFQLLTRDFANLSSLDKIGLIPSFGDLDGDGDADMIVGDANGKLHRYENNAGAGNPMIMNLNQLDYLNVGSTAKDAAPQLFDYNQDGKLDLIVGERINKFIDSNGVNDWKGNLNYFENTGTTTNPAFTLTTEFLGGVDVTDSIIYSSRGHATPCFFEDSLGNVSLFSGNAKGNVMYYKNITINPNTPFDIDRNMYYVDPNYGYDTLWSTMFFLEDTNRRIIREGIYSGVAVADINNDGFMDLFVGNYAGGLAFFKGVVPPDLGVGINETAISNPIDVQLFPNPGNGSFTLVIDHFQPKWSANPEMIIYDLAGRKISERISIDQARSHFDFSHLENGLYLVKVRQGLSSKTLKLLIRK